MSVDAAFELLRAHARRTNQRLSEVARRAVTDLRSLRELSGDDLDTRPPQR